MSSEYAASGATQFDYLEPQVQAQMPRLEGIGRMVLSANQEHAEEPQDVAQETMIRYWENAENLAAGNIASWMGTVAYRYGVDIRRRWDSHPALLLSRITDDDADDRPVDQLIAATAPSPEEVVEQAELSEIIRQCAAMLPEKYARIVLLRLEPEGYTFADIGKILSIAASTAKVYFTRAKPLLRELLREQGITHA